MKIAVDMVEQRLLTEREALLRIDASKADFFMHLHLRPNQLDSVTPLGKQVIYCVSCSILHNIHSASTGSGLSASRGVVTAPVVFSSSECMDRSMRGDVRLPELLRHCVLCFTLC